MSIFDLFKRAGKTEGRSLTADNGWLNFTTLDQLTSSSGEKVTPMTATQATAVYGSWRIISEMVATLPRDTMRRRNGIAKPFRPRPDWLDSPNASDSWIDFMGQLMVSLLGDGNAYVAVSWGAEGSVDNLVVLDPAAVTPEKVKGSVMFRIGGVLVPGVRGLAATEIMHVRGMTRPGHIEGISPITACAETIGITLAAQRYGANFFGQDATPGGVLEVPPEASLSPTGQAALREAWGDLFGGAKRAKKVAVLVDGVKFNQLQVNPNEAQFLETRRFQVADVARIYGVPPHLLADSTKATSWGTGIAEQNQAFVTLTLRPWLERVESAFTDLLKISEVRKGILKPQLYLNLNEEALLRTDPKQRWDRHRANVTAGLWTADEARADEGMDPLPDGVGSEPWIPLAQSVGVSGRENDEPGEILEDPAAEEGTENED